MIASLFQGAINTHQHRLGVRAPSAAIAIAVLANQHGSANRPFGMIVVERHAGFVQKRKQIITVTTQTLDQTAGFWVLPRRFNPTLTVGLGLEG